MLVPVECSGVLQNVWEIVKLFLFHIAKRLNKDICYRCGNKIDTVRELSIDHIQSWYKSSIQEFKPELFFDVTNCKMSHLHCNCSAARGGKGLESKYMGIH